MKKNDFNQLESLSSNDLANIDGGIYPILPLGPIIFWLLIS